jgi:tetratricopeptide (TPR) repeat protein
MMADRLAQLQALLAEEPGDPFLRYAIALERKRSGDMETAAGDLELLLQENPKYIACYYQLALVLADLGRLADAAEACKAGALQCLVTGDAKARAELLALGAQLMAED